jgi:hypothetical protein
MASGSNATVTVVARTGTGIGATTNVATVSSGTPDPDPTNNTASVTFAALIPTMSTLLLALMAFVLATTAVLKLK